MSRVKDKEHALELLKSNKCLYYGAWVFNLGGMDCNDLECPCYSEFKSVSDAANSLESYCCGRWNEVTY